MFKRLAQSNNNAAAASSEYASFSSVRNDYERGDIALGDDVKKQNNFYEHGDIALGRNDTPKANADYGVLPSNGYGSVLTSNDGYGPVLK